MHIIFIFRGKEGPTFSADIMRIETLYICAIQNSILSNNVYEMMKLKRAPAMSVIKQTIYETDSWKQQHNNDTNIVHSLMDYQRQRDGKEKEY